MLIGGLWHGANWTFVVWGAIHGGYLVGERIVKEKWQGHELGLPVPVVKTLQWVLTFNVVCLAWVFFRAQSVDAAFDVLGQLFTRRRTRGYVGILVIVTVVASIASQFVPPAHPRAGRGLVRQARSGPADRRPGRGPGAGRCPRPRGHRPVHLLPVLMATPPASAPGPVGLSAAADPAHPTGTLAPMTAPRPMKPGRPPRRPGSFDWRSLFRPFRARKEGTMPAGLVLILVVGSLLIAMFLNADATLRKSEAKGDGWRNEIAKGIASVSDTLRITSLRGDVDDALGKNQGTDTDVEESAGPEGGRVGRRHRGRPCCR